MCRHHLKGTFCGIRLSGSLIIVTDIDVDIVGARDQLQAEEWELA